MSARILAAIAALATVARGAAAQEHAHPAPARERPGWSLSVQGAIFAGLDVQRGPRGDSEWIAPNWIMATAEGPLGGGTLEPRLMLSFDPATVGADGYPLLLQTGETFEGRRLIDRQHPHDFFTELALRWAYPLGGGVALVVYGALSGEPALGPPAFFHRPSAAADPLAPLGHHWEEATHISFGVATLALRTRRAALEASWFNGREPDEERWDLDLRPFDSVAARLSVTPTERLGLQASWGRLDEPEALEPGVSVHRITASAAYGGAGVAVLALWGRNVPSEGFTTDAFLLEATVSAGRAGTPFGRVEAVEKQGEDLVLPDVVADRTYWVGSLVLGWLVDLYRVGPLTAGAGVRGSVNLVGETLERFYGSRFPAGIMVYLRVSTAPRSGGGGHGH